MGYGALASKLISGVGGAVAGGLNAGAQNNLHDAQIQAFANLPAAPDLLKQFLSGWTQQNQQTSGQAMNDLKLRLGMAPTEAKYSLDLLKQYGPQFAKANLASLKAFDPQFTSGYAQLGNTVSNELSQGRNLSPDQLSQANADIQAAQAGRGNVIGSSPVAAQSLFDAQTRNAMFQQRLGNMQSYLNGASPEARAGGMYGIGAGALGQETQNISAPGNQYYQNPTSWGPEFASLAQTQWGDTEQNALAQAHAAYGAVPGNQNPWLASLASGFGALAGSGAGAGFTGAGGGGAGPMPNTGPGGAGFQGPTGLSASSPTSLSDGGLGGLL